jgi:hypothetical protein
MGRMNTTAPTTTTKITIYIYEYYETLKIKSERYYEKKYQQQLQHYRLEYPSSMTCLVHSIIRAKKRQNERKREKTLTYNSIATG